MNWFLVVLLVVGNSPVRHTMSLNRQINEDNSAKVFEEEQIVEEPIDENKSNFDSEVKSFEQQQEKTGASSKHAVERVKNVNKTCFDNSCDDFEKLQSVKELLSSKNEVNRNKNVENRNKNEENYNKKAENYNKNEENHDKNEENRNKNQENRFKNKTDIQEQKTVEKHKTDIILVNENDSETVENDQFKDNPHNRNVSTEGNDKKKTYTKTELIKKIDNPNSNYILMTHDKNCTSNDCTKVRANPKAFIKKQMQNIVKTKNTSEAKEKSTNRLTNHSIITTIYNHSESSVFKPEVIRFNSSQLSSKNKTSNDIGTTAIKELLKKIEEKNMVGKTVEIKSNCTGNICTNNKKTESKKKNDENSSEILKLEFNGTQDINENFLKHNKEFKTNDKLKLNNKELISNETLDKNDKESYSNESLKVNDKASNLKEIENSNGSLKNALKERLNEIIKKLTKIGKSEKEDSEVQEEYDENNDLTISSAQNIDCVEDCLMKLKKLKLNNSLRDTDNDDKLEIGASESDENESEKVPEPSEAKSNLEEQEEIEDRDNDNLNDHFQSALNTDKNNNSFIDSEETKNSTISELSKSTNETAFINKVLENTTKDCSGTDCLTLEKNITTEMEGTNKTSQFVNSTDRNDSEEETHESSNSKSIDLSEFNDHKKVKTLVKQEQEETDNILNVSNKHKFEYSLLRASKVQVPNQNRYPIATNTSSEFLAEILPKSKDRMDEAKDSNAIKKNDCTNAFCISKNVFSSKDQKERTEQKHLLKNESED